ncbi:Crp/Fnr family transcriptional regulator [Streptomyces humi]|uniref:Crp/Fnr family transcriptional regulator n=1 Tax=Streptomyces humi TaxID=1428620 RepID=UPI003B847059
MPSAIIGGLGRPGRSHVAEGGKPGPFASWAPGSYLGQLSDGARRTLLQAGTRRSYAAGDVLFREGDPSSYLLMIAEGLVKVSAAAPTGQEPLLVRERRGRRRSAVPDAPGHLPVEGAPEPWEGPRRPLSRPEEVPRGSPLVGELTVSASGVPLPPPCPPRGL